MRAGYFKPAGGLLAILISFAAMAQPVGVPLQPPEKFTVDKQAAARLRPMLLAQSTEASGRYAIGVQVLRNLVAHLPPGDAPRYRWELRIANADLLNAFSSPDGTIYVDGRLGQLAGAKSGLWAAILSHEIVHVVRRDWARRYLYQKSLQDSGGAVVLNDSGPGAAMGWMDAKHASETLATFCRQMEFEADAEGVMLMARSGYHPAFVAALNHALHAEPSGSVPVSEFAMHPRWQTRDHELERAYAAAGKEFDRLWPERYSSPGGEPPVVVFAEEPTVRTLRATEWEIRIPMRCQNLAGAVEVVLRTARNGKGLRPEHLRAPNDEIRQITGCTSNRTLITFSLDNARDSQPWSDVYVLDDSGSVLARAEVPRR